VTARKGDVVKKSFVAVVAVAAATALAAAGALGGEKAVAPGKLTIAYQPGLGYAPLILMKQEKTIEKRFPGTQVDWKVLASGTPITNGVIAGDIQIGAVGVGPMLVGWARGVNWKVIAPLNEGDLWLMAKDPAIKTIADLRGKRIATPTRTSIQAVTLRKMAETKLGNARALDSGLIDIDHPDGMIKKNPDRVAKVLQQDAGGNPTNRQFKQWLVNPALNWTTRPRGLMRTANFMFRTQQIGKMPPNWRELVFPPVYATKGS
jgi:hypothetical protein